MQKVRERPCRQLQNRSRTWQELQWSIEGEGNTFHGSSAASLVGFLEEFLKPRSLFVLCIGYCYWVHYGNWNALLGLLGPKRRFGEERRRWEWGALEPAELQRQRPHVCDDAIASDKVSLLLSPTHTSFTFFPKWITCCNFNRTILTNL